MSYPITSMYNIFIFIHLSLLTISGYHTTTLFINLTVIPSSLTSLPHSLSSSAARRVGLQLKHGHRYYVTVRACNPLGLCTIATSNGVTVDSTPPIPGKLFNGYSIAEGNLQFQASR